MVNSGEIVRRVAEVVRAVEAVSPEDGATLRRYHEGLRREARVLARRVRDLEGRKRGGRDGDA